MTGSAYAGGWHGFGRLDCSAFEQVKEELRAAMTGRKGGHGFQHGGRPPFGGPGPFGGQGPFGAWGFGGPPWANPRGSRGPKARRGDIRAAILAVLAEQPMNGYQIIQEVAERSGGAWKPSPGSIYPTLQQLEDEGLVTADAVSGRRTFTLTDEGRAYVAAHADEVSAPWEAMTAQDDDENGLKPILGQVATAMWQIMAAGSPEQQAKARDAVITLRRTLYTILADDEESGDDSRARS
ncbi:PadR family transcriptional regulator [Kribbella sp. CA-293567]|uniref:PadR family transcriptional regulator n=1 Tax=Kribbella sp. CA-293567 TaxID=3002436 RepID=UPI0022DDC724|nr:PadR family transcriptional regulator [Kribbella sp. CA-293567]WBQ06693.1 PadR family transcriptional regulator [Kribbella sp. CA-293567]